MTLTQVARHIRTKRKQLNMTQKDLSKISGLAQNRISSIENGVYTPTLSTLVRVVESLGDKLVIVPKEK